MVGTGPTLDGLYRLAFGPLVLEPGGLLAWLVAVLLAGWLAGQLVRGHGFGCLGDILLGIIGSIVGLIVLGLLPLHLDGTVGFLGTLVVSFLGALLLAGIGRLLGGARGYSR